MNRIERDPLQKKLEITNWLILLIFIALSASCMPVKFTLGVGMGGLISIVNYHWLSRSLRNVFQRLSGGARFAIMFRYYIRFIITGAVLYFIISRYLVDVIGLLIGLSIVVINIVVTVMMMLAKKNRTEEVCIEHGTPVDP